MTAVTATQASAGTDGEERSPCSARFQGGRSRLEVDLQTGFTARSGPPPLMPTMRRQSHEPSAHRGGSGYSGSVSCHTLANYYK